MRAFLDMVILETHFFIPHFQDEEIKKGLLPKLFGPEASVAGPRASRWKMFGPEASVAGPNANRWKMFGPEASVAGPNANRWKMFVPAVLTHMRQGSQLKMVFKVSTKN
jgi:hypothetical protein